MGMREDLARMRQGATPPPKTNGHITEDELRAHGIIETPAPEPIIPPDDIPERRTPPPEHRKLATRQSYLPDIHRPLPASIDAEKGVLGSILMAAARGPENARKMMFFLESAIGENHFHLPAHRHVFQAMKRLHSDNDPLDLITITNELESAGQLAEAGGADVVTELVTYVPTDANVDHYAAILQEKLALRQILELGNRLSAGAYDPGQDDPGFLIDQAAETLKAIRTSKKIGQLPDLDDMTDLLDNMPPAPPELVTGILHRGSKLIIGGTSKGRKTFSLIDLAISVATGTPWWGCPTIMGRVCYINFEIQRPFFAKRYRDICAKKGATPGRGMFKCWTLRGFSEGLEKMSANLIKILLQEDYALIVFDPIYKALGDRDENKAGDVASMLNELESIAVKTGSAIAFGAHYSKGNQAAKDAMDRIGGSGVFARDPDAILTMTPHEEEECFTVDTTLRNFPPQPPFVVRWEWPLFTRDEAADPEAIKLPKRTRMDNGQSTRFTDIYTPDDLLDLLKENPQGLRTDHLREQATRELGGSKETFYRKWKIAKASPFIVEKKPLFFHIQSITNPKK